MATTHPFSLCLFLLFMNPFLDKLTAPISSIFQWQGRRGAGFGVKASTEETSQNSFTASPKATAIKDSTDSLQTWSYFQTGNTQNSLRWTWKSLTFLNLRHIPRVCSVYMIMYEYDSIENFLDFCIRGGVWFFFFFFLKHEICFWESTPVWDSHKPKRSAVHICCCELRERFNVT